MIHTADKLKTWGRKLFGRDGAKAERSAQKDNKKRRVNARLIVLVLLVFYLTAALYPYATVPDCPDPIIVQEHLYANDCSDDRAEILVSGEEAFDARIRMIAGSNESIIISTYLFADDESGHLLASALMAAADRGVQVRIVLDGLIGRINLAPGNLGFVLGAHRNVALRYYNTVNLMAPSGINARNHEKYMIADGQMMVLGGRNISDEFLTGPDHPAYNDDLDVLVFSRNPGIHSPAMTLTHHFEQMWNDWCTPAYSFVPEKKALDVEALENELRERYEALSSQRPELFLPINWISRTIPIDGFTLLSNPTDPFVREPVLWTALMTLMQQAKERIWIQTPYLILNSGMHADLAAAAGMPQELEMLINSRASGNNFIASADFLLQKRTFKHMDMNLYEFQGDNPMHTKALLIDSCISVFGSFNFDIRSAHINTEAMLVVYSEEINKMLEEHMEGMFALSTPVYLSQEQEVHGQDDLKPISFIKNLKIHLLSPFVRLFRFLI